MEEICCPHCALRILDAKEEEALERFIVADRQFDGGEFSQHFDYYKNYCTCCSHGHDMNDHERQCGECLMEDRMAWEAEQFAMITAREKR